MPPAPPGSPGPARLRTKPLLRGVSHAVAAVAAVPVALGIVGSARSRSGVVGAAVYGASLVLLFLVSAVYHRGFWAPPVRRVLGRIDHSAIFLLIAGTYTPLCLLLGPGAGYALLATVWVGAGIGILIVIAWVRIPKPLRSALYVLLGWFIVPFLPALRAAMGGRALLLLLAGGLSYTVGAVVYAVRRPDPLPTVFGFHEVFHLLVIAAAICQSFAVEAAVRSMG